jgi:hypothetical protein
LHPSSRRRRVQNRRLLQGERQLTTKIFGAWIALVVSLAACATVPAATSRATPEAAEPAPPGPNEVCSTDAQSAESVAVCNLPDAGSFRVRNDSKSALGLLAHIDVEVEDESHVWHASDALVYLDPACHAEPPAERCVTLGAGATLSPQPWTGLTCSGQCRPACAGDHYLRGMSLRFVVSTCDGVDRYAGPAFRLEKFEDVPLPERPD